MLRTSSSLSTISIYPWTLRVASIKTGKHELRFLGILFFSVVGGKLSSFSHNFLHIVSSSYCFSASISYLYLWHFLFALRRFLGFIAFLLLSITLDSFSQFFFIIYFWDFLFFSFSMNFCLTFRLALPWLVVAFVAYLYGEVFLENKRWKFQMLFAPKSFCYIFSFFSFCLVAYLGFELRLWLALKVLYELRISFNSLAGAVIATDRRRWRLRSVVYNFGFSSADFPFPFRAVVSFS